MSEEIYELTSLVMRYVFVVLGVVIVLRAWRSIARDNAQAARIRERTAGAGCVGELVVVRGAGDIAPGMRFPMYEECRVGSSPRSDIRINHRSVRPKHAYIEKRADTFVVTSLSLFSPVKRKRGAGGGQLTVKNGENIVIGDFTLKILDYDAPQRVSRVRKLDQARVVRVKPKKAVKDVSDEWKDW